MAPLLPPAIADTVLCIEGEANHFQFISLERCWGRHFITLLLKFMASDGSDGISVLYRLF